MWISQELNFKKCYNFSNWETPSGSCTVASSVVSLSVPYVYIFQLCDYLSLFTSSHSSLWFSRVSFDLKFQFAGFPAKKSVLSPTLSWCSFFNNSKHLFVLDTTCLGVRTNNRITTLRERNLVNLFGANFVWKYHVWWLIQIWRSNDLTDPHKSRISLCS